jgi:hypothetical protein
MKNVLFALSVLACAAAAPAAAIAAPVCVSFSPAGYCDSMQFDTKKKATWVYFDCANSSKQTKANYKKGTTVCDGSKGCDPSATYGWEFLNWKFDKKMSTGTLTGVSGGVEYILQQDMPVAYSSGACTGLGGKGGVSSMAR